MSLFGGSAPPSRSSYESDTSESSSTRSSPSVVETSDPHNAQKLEIPVPLDVNDDLDTDTESEEDESEDEEDEDEEPARPNRFEGEPKTWRAYTEAERQIVESLETMQNSDLSAQLYNAHALKRRLQRPAHELAQLKNWHSKDIWLKSEEDWKYTDAAGIIQEDTVPPDEWTAWPVPPTELPDCSESLDDGLVSGTADDSTLGSASKQQAGEELREELLAVFLRIAKDRWNMRDASSSASDTEVDSRPSRSRSRSKSAKSIPSRSTSRATFRASDYSGSDGEGTGSGTSEERDRASGKQRGRKAQPGVSSKPVSLADDARAQRLLQPSIQSIMTKLDDLALAIYRARLNHLSHGGSGDSSISGFTSGTESSGPASRLSSRVASRSVSRAASRASSRAPSENPRSRSPSIRPSSRASSIQASRALSQSMQDIHANAIDSDDTFGDASDWESFIETPRRRKRRRSSSSASVSDTSTIQGEKLRIAPVDWSEVLGLAAVKGWDAGAVARTAQRCATLFGESMSFMPFDESRASKTPPKPVWYTPSTIPAPSILSTTESSTPKRPLFQLGTLSCPHADCEDHGRTFASTHRVIEHCLTVHGYDPRTNNSGNEERMAGGVHIDGFLQPITLKPGWMNEGRARKKQPKVESSSQPALEAVFSPVE